MIVIKYGDVISSSLVSEPMFFTVTPHHVSNEWQTLETVLGLGVVSVKDDVVINRRVYHFTSRKDIYLRINQLRKDCKRYAIILAERRTALESNTELSKQEYANAFVVINSVEIELSDLERHLTYSRTDE